MICFSRLCPSEEKASGNSLGVSLPNAPLLIGIAAGDGNDDVAIVLQVFCKMANFMMYSITDGAMAPQGQAMG